MAPDLSAASRVLADPARSSVARFSRSSIVPPRNSGDYFLGPFQEVSQKRSVLTSPIFKEQESRNSNPVVSERFMCGWIRPGVVPNPSFEKSRIFLFLPRAVLFRESFRVPRSFPPSVPPPPPSESLRNCTGRSPSVFEVNPLTKDELSLKS